jgi:hypothetical protein
VLGEDFSAVFILFNLNDGFGVWYCGLKAKLEAANS